MIKSDQAVSLAASEAGLKLHHRLASLSREPAGGDADQIGQPLGDESAGIEGPGVLVFLFGPLMEHLPKVGRELGLGEAAFPNVGVRRHHLSPGRVLAAGPAVGGVGFDKPLPLVAAFLFIDLPLQGLFEVADLIGLFGGLEVFEHHLALIEDADGVVGAERFEMRPIVAGIAQKGYVVASLVRKHLAENGLPSRLNALDQEGQIVGGGGVVGLIEHTVDLLHPVGSVHGFPGSLHPRPDPVTKQGESLPHSFVVGNSHDLPQLSKRLACSVTGRAASSVRVGQTVTKVL